MATIAVLGAGAMGSAFCVPLVDSGHEVHLIGTHLDRLLIEEVASTGYHPKIDSRLPEGIFTHTIDKLSNVLRLQLDLVVLGVSSAGVDWAVKKLSEALTRLPPLLLLTKGLRADEGIIRTLPGYMAESLARQGLDRAQIGAVGGPCIASELAARRDSSVVFAYRENGVLEKVSSLFDCSHYHIRESTDVIGVELCAALKNFYAIAVGYPLGRAETGGKRYNAFNPSAAVFSQAISEMSYLVEHGGGSFHSVYGLPGLADLYVTCQAGRNSRLGRYLGRGLCYREIMEAQMRDETVEGAVLAAEVGPTILALCEEGALDRGRIPLAVALIRSICDNSPFSIDWESFPACPTLQSSE
ncbi:MAG: glycerol-3-phosphate dehydrogenase [Spirochaetales bacterium]|nr:glycerol-3-phosphate dehydrogenase [Spirochaetales bacterium]